MSWIAYFLIKGVSWILGHLPVTAALWCGKKAAQICYAFHKRKWFAYANLRAAFPGKYSGKELRSIVRKMYENLGQTFVELLRFPYVTKDYADTHFILTDGSLERIQQALSHGNGVVFLTAHLDNWELAGYYSAMRGFPLQVLATMQKHTKVNDLLNTYREIPGNTVIGKGMPLREMMAALKENKLVAIVGDQGGAKTDMYIRFFDRLAATPDGAFRIAQKLNSVILPCIMTRLDHGKHEVHICDTIPHDRAEDKEESLRIALEEYVCLLEERITMHPEQWMWGHKRWKHCHTKRVTVISDGKAGHENQSKAVYEMLRAVAIEEEPAYEFSMTVIPIVFKNVRARAIFRFFGWMLIPFTRGRMEVLRWFVDDTTLRALTANYCDIVISTGSSVIPFSLMLKRENAAKNVVVMTPSFPLNLFYHELIIKHKHDKRPDGNNVVETCVAPTLVTQDVIETETQRFVETYGLDRGKKYMCLLIGGETKNFSFDASIFSRFIAEVKVFAEEHDYYVVLTNSRRTRTDITDLLVCEFDAWERCAVFVNVTVHNPQSVVYGMMGIADMIFVTEESVSMISESVQSKTKVMLVKPSRQSVAAKHTRFHAVLRDRGLVRVLEQDDMSGQIARYCEEKNVVQGVHDTAMDMRKRLKELI